MNSNTLKFLGAALLLGTWGAFAFFGKTPVDGFIAAVGAALSGLGVYHVSTSSNAPATAQAPAALPQEPATPAQPAAPQA
jgi:hypothetical protein